MKNIADIMIVSLSRMLKRVLSSNTSCVRIPMWRMMPHIRSRFFLRKEYLTTYDEGIKIYCRLNDHIESQCGMQVMKVTLKVENI